MGGGSAQRGQKSCCGHLYTNHCKPLWFVAAYAGEIHGPRMNCGSVLWGLFFLLVGQAQSVAPIRRGPGPKVERPALQAVGEEHDDHRRQREGPVVPRTHAATVQDTGLHHKTPSSFVLKRF